MLNKQQIEISDYILKYLESSGGKSSIDDYPQKLQKNGFDDFESSFVIDYLIKHVGLIDHWKIDRWIRLTPTGYKAAKTGIEEYLKEVEKQKQLESESLSASIEGDKTAKRTAKTSRILSIIAIVSAIIIPFSIEIFNNVVNKPTDTNTNSKNGIENSNSTIPYSFADTLFIEEIKSSLKHDTVFLNEIKYLINKN